MENVTPLFVKLIAIIVGFVAVLSTVYIWVLPEIFHGYKTYSLFAIGVIAAALLGGNYCYQIANVLASATSKVLLAFLGGFGVAALVSFLSLLIILNVRGS
jgi:hypothetical protein